MNTDSTSSEDEYNPSNRQDYPRTARKSTNALQPQSRAGPSTRRQAAKKASRAISAEASTSSTSASTSSFDKTMETFNPDMSQREKRKINKKFQTPAPNTRKPLGAVYDERGRHISSGLDLCDCLNERCQGCFFECVKCGSQKCGTECRVHRNYIIDSIEYHGRDKTVRNPLLRQ